MKYVIEPVYFTEGKPTYVEGKIIHVQLIKECDDPYREGDYVALCIIEK